VAAVALPEYGKKYMEKWLKSDDKDVQWVMRENLKKEAPGQNGPTLGE
jgi:hypothetical protein